MQYANNVDRQYEDRLVEAWESVYKKGQLTLWILLALKNDNMHMSAIKNFIDFTARGTISADDRSMYRALRRFKSMNLVDYVDEKSDRGGPDRKVYRLTETGSNVLLKFIKKNIIDIYYQRGIEKLIKGVNNG